jgi:hypothetical protein
MQKTKSIKRVRRAIAVALNVNVSEVPQGVAAEWKYYLMAA